MVTYDQIVSARTRIADGIIYTPCSESPALSELCGCRVFTKREYLQRTGSFKERGARNAMLLLPEEARKQGVVAASAGNHALALAYHGRDLGIPVTVVMPRFSPIVKQSRCAQYGARVLLSGDNIGEAKVLADELVQKEGLTYVHGFDGQDVIAGQGTIGLEILEQVPEADVVIVPVGGAGLIAGVGLAIKTASPKTEVIGVEAANAASFSAALSGKAPVPFDVQPTLSDGLAVPTVGPNAYEIAEKVVDRVVLVDEETTALAILRMLELEKGVVEGAGATPLAALLGGTLSDLAGKKVVLLLGGGNIDPSVLGRVIDHAMVTDGRIGMFRAVISDRPGGLAELGNAIAEAGASVREIRHERAFASADVSTVEVECTVDTRNRDHLGHLLQHLKANGIPCHEQAWRPWN